MTAPLDPGLQPERTELAWRRTALAIAVGSLIALRVLPVTFDDPWWVMGGIAGLLVAAAIWLLARRRIRLVGVVLAREGNRARMPGAAPLAALSVFVLATGITAVVIVLVA